MPPLLAPIIQFFLTVFYFFYFLAKGKPEWKCPNEKHGGENVKIENVCCDGDTPVSSLYTSQSSQSGIRERIRTIPSTIHDYWKRLVQWIRSQSHAMKTRCSIQSIRRGLKRIGASVVSLLGSAWQIISTFFSTIFSFLLFRRAPSKTMPTSEVIYSSHEEKEKSIPSLSVASTPVPFFPSSPSSSVPPPPPPPPPPPRQTRVPSSHKEEVITVSNEDSKKEGDNGWKGGAFYSTRVFATKDEVGKERTRDSPVKGISSSSLCMREAVKGGIAVFPPSVMAEIAGSGGGSDQVTRSQVNRTPNPTVKERLREASLTPTHKGTEEYLHETAPITRTNPLELTSSKSCVGAPKAWGSYEERAVRAKSAGPPRVSRIEDSSSNEAQFIFRAHGSDEDMGHHYRMGRSAYPMTERETSRALMNRQMDSRATTPSIWSCNTSRVSTPALNTREEESGMRYRGGRMSTSRGRVGERARQWPPPPNAEGADIGKECFVDGNGVITTACTRIVQKKNEESWRWFDNNGRMIDEKNEFSLMGDKDEVRRGGPYQANHYSQHYFVDRDGTTRFENTQRQYDRDYVVESVCTNY